MNKTQLINLIVILFMMFFIILYYLGKETVFPIWVYDLLLVANAICFIFPEEENKK